MEPELASPSRHSDIDPSPSSMDHVDPTKSRIVADLVAKGGSSIDSKVWHDVCQFVQTCVFKCVRGNY